MLASYKKSLHAAFMVVFYLALGLRAYAQSSIWHPSTALYWILSGAVVPNATVEIHNPVSHFDRSTTTDSFREVQLPKHPIQSLPFERHGGGFAPYAQDVELRSAVPLDIKINSRWRDLPKA